MEAGLMGSDCCLNASIAALIQMLEWPNRVLFGTLKWSLATYRNLA